MKSRHRLYNGMPISRVRKLARRHHNAKNKGKRGAFKW